MSAIRSVCSVASATAPKSKRISNSRASASYSIRCSRTAASRLDRLAFQRALDDIGADEHAGTDFDLQVLAHSFDRGVALLADNELHPALPPEAMNVVARQLAQVVAARIHSPGYLTQRSLRAALFPPEDPILREATPESVRALTLEDVRGYYPRCFGRISPPSWWWATSRRAGARHHREILWRMDGAGTEAGHRSAGGAPNQPSTVAVPDASRVQDNVVLAQNLALRRSDPDYYPLELGSAVLGGGFYSTRLSIELRKNNRPGVLGGLDTAGRRTRGAYFIQYACDSAERRQSRAHRRAGTQDHAEHAGRSD